MNPDFDCSDKNSRESLPSAENSAIERNEVSISSNAPSEIWQLDSTPLDLYVVPTDFSEGWMNFSLRRFLVNEYRRFSRLLQHFLQMLRNSLKLAHTQQKASVSRQPRMVLVVDKFTGLIVSVYLTYPCKK